MRPGRLLLIVPLVLSGFGIKEMHVYFTNPQPKEISIDALMTAPPDAEWLRVTGAKMDLSESLVLENKFSKRAEELYIPLRPHPGEEGVVRIVALLRTKDPEMLKLADQLKAASDSPNAEQEVLSLAMAHMDLIHQQRPFDGLVAFGLDDNDKRLYQAKKKLHQLVDQPVIIREGETPSFIRGLIILTVATVMGLILWLVTARRSTPPPLPPPLPGPAA